VASSRDAIFAAMRAAAATRPRAPSAERPRYAAPPVLSASIETLAASLDAAGAPLVRCAAHELGAMLARIPGFARAAHVWSALPEAPARGVALTARVPHDLAALDFAVVRGELIVAESGAVWNSPRSPLERAAALLAEHLVLVVPDDAIVPSLHDAYVRIDPAASAFGWFLAGPSKTADIEQALVLGAHGPCAATVVLTSVAT
jgi:L-lactate dehydrogenase complex protein LldG